MGIEANLETPLARAVRAMKSQSAYGRLVERSQSWVYECLRREKPVLAEHVAKVEAATGISRHELRPDIFGPAPAPEAMPGQSDLEPNR